MKIKFPRHLSYNNNYQEINKRAKDILDTNNKLVKQDNGDDEDNNYIYVTNMNIDNEKLIEYLNTAYNKKSCLMFHKCKLDKINIDSKHLECLVFFDCEINSISMNYKKNTANQFSRLQFLNTKVKTFIKINGYDGALAIVNTIIGNESNISLNSCTGVKVFIYEIVEEQVFFTANKSSQMELHFYAINKSIILDKVSSEFENFVFYPEFKSKYQMELFSVTTRDYYYYLKSIHSDERFIYLKIYKDLDMLSCRGLESLTKRIVGLITGHFISPFRIFLLSIIVILIFSIIYLYTGFEIVDGDYIRYYPSFSFGLTTKHFWKAVYLSVITFSTVGYGNVIPCGFGEVFACIEMIFGVAYFGLFTGTIFNRYVD
ncbi:MAG: potassium channel family protein [Clostridia bacterium]|nr:potassium channel family protein [Clostridia bacterium]